MFSQQQHIFTGFSIHHHNLSTSIYFTICLHCIYDYSTSMNLLLVDRFQKAFFMKVAGYVEEEWMVVFVSLYGFRMVHMKLSCCFRKLFFFGVLFFSLSCLALLLPCSFFSFYSIYRFVVWIIQRTLNFFFAGERIYEW